MGSYIGGMLVEYRRLAYFPVLWGPLNKRFGYRKTSVQISGALSGLLSSRQRRHLIALLLNYELKLRGRKLTIPLRSWIHL